jgi:hypothetical protein
MALEIKDFIVLHYSSVLRGDSEYWKDIRLNQKMSPELIEELSRVRANDWGSVARNKKYFGVTSWILVCISQNVMGHSLPSSLSWQGVDIDKLNDGEKTSEITIKTALFIREIPPIIKTELTRIETTVSNGAM